MFINDLSELTGDALAQYSKAISKQNAQDVGSLQKDITQATGLVWYDLQAPSKNLFPVLTPLRNKIPRVAGRGGTATNWKSVTAINTNNLRGFVPEGFRNGAVATAVQDKNAAYKSLGLEDNVTFEADLAALNFENVRATTGQRLLWATMLEEEYAILGANNSIELGTPTAPTVGVTDGGGTVPDGTYNVAVVALTADGYLSSSVANGVVRQVAVTTVDGETFNYGGGSSNKSSTTTTGAISNGNDSSIEASTPVINGAVAYAWYVGTAGNEKLEAITTINSVSVKSLAGTGQDLADITADNSINQYAFDGLLYQAWTPGSNAYIKALDTGTPGVGTPLATDNAGGIVQIDEMLESLWVNYKLSPTEIYVNAQEGKSITSKLLGSTGVNYNLFTPNPSAAMGELTAGANVGSYLNSYAMGTKPRIPIEVHPWLAPGTIHACTTMLPYPITNVPNVMEMILRRDYYQMEWPLRRRRYETGVYMDGVLAHYFPPSLGIITNIAKG